jgi:hypothetical protein
MRASFVVFIWATFLSAAACSQAQDSLNVHELWQQRQMQHAKDVVVRDGIAYVAAHEAGLHIFNINNPALPREIGFCSTPGYAYGIAVQGDYAYVSCYSGGLCIIDISNPALPSEVGNCFTPDLALGIAVDGNYAYVACREGGLRIFDISNPFDPTEVSSLVMNPWVVLRIAAHDNHVYLTGHGFHVIDVSDPTAPLDVGECGTPSYVQSISISGEYAYLADSDSGLQIINISSPDNPTEVARYPIANSALGVTVHDEFAYVTSVVSQSDCNIWRAARA